MRDFWHFARQMGRYRRLWAIAMIAVCLDAATAFAGFGVLTLIIRLLFEDGNPSVRTIAEQRLTDPDTVARYGDWSTLASVIPAEPIWGLATVLGFVLLIAAVGSCFRVAHQFLSITIAQRTSMRIRAAAFHRVLHAPMTALWQTGSADLMSRVVQDSSRLTRGFLTITARAVRDVLMGLVFVAWAMIYSWELTLIFLLGVAPIAVAMRKFGKRIRRASKYALRGYGVMIAAMQEAMQNAAVVRTHNAEGYERRRFASVNRELYRQEMKARTVRSISSPVIELIGLAGVMTVVLVAAVWVFRDGSVEPADMLFVLVALAVAGGSVKPLSNINNDLQEAAAAATRLRETIDQPAEPNRGDDWRRPALPRHAREVRFASVTFTYPGKTEPALRDLALVVPHGATCALVGPNGSGKTTALSLLTRLVDPDAGAVLIDGHDLRGVSLRSLRKQLAVVPQHPAVFSGTVADNIAYGRRHAARADLVAAARAAHADTFIEQLPHGYDTVLGEGGTGLSGGQKQRLCIARAILRDPAILVLDEATSQVDTESEHHIQQALRRVRQGRTTFIIAHRMSTVVDADLIAVLDGGRLIDHGTHAELLERCGVYQTLVHHQLEGLVAGA